MAFEISINDLPTEIIEMFAPDLSTSTLKILRLVNKRFYSVFSQGKFWKRHLLFAEKQYLCDVRSNSTASGVEDVLEEIAQGRINQMQGYFKLQNIHIENWLSGSIENLDIINLIPSTVSCMKEVVDDDNERWLVFSDNDQQIHIWNITAKPCPLTPLNIGPHSKLNVLPGGKLLVKDDTFDKHDGLVAIYKFEKSGIHLQCKFAYYMDSKLEALQEPVPGSCFNFRFIVVGSYFIGYNCKISSYHGNLLYFWNLDCCTKMCSISLSELDCNDEFQDLVKACGTAEENDITRSCKGCYINLHQGIYPDVLISLRYPRDRLSVVTIFNVEIMRVTHLIDTLESNNIISCSMNCDSVSCGLFSCHQLQCSSHCKRH